MPLLFGVLVAGCVSLVSRFSVSNTMPVCKNCNVIIISLDTVGAPHLPCYGYIRNTASNLCSFAKQNILFQNAFVNSTWTLPSDVSLFTSLYPTTHGIRDYTDYTMRLSPSLPFLPEILQKAGYYTIFGIPGNDRAFPIDDVYYRGISKVIPHTPGPDEDLDSALAAFKDSVLSGRKTFMFLHSYQAHGPYIPKNPKKMFTDDMFPHIPTTWPDIYGEFSEDFYRYLLDELVKTVDKPNAVIDRAFYEKLAHAPTLFAAEKIASTKETELESYFTEYYYFAKIKRSDPAQVEYVKALYDQKIFELDEWIGKRLLPLLDDPKIRDNTIVIFTSEHGEEFMEHGRMTHVTLYDSNVKVPLIMKIPGYGPVSVNTPVQGVDIMPTILGLVGLSMRPYRLQGANLGPLIAGGAFGDRLVVVDGYTDKTVRTNKWKLFLKRIDNTLVPYELYDVVADPSESTNMLASEIGIMKELLRKTVRYEALWSRLIRH